MFKGIIEEHIEPSTLVLRVQPDEGISLEFQTKNPGAKLCLNKVLMDFSYQTVFTFEAYERVLLDCMQGDQMLFVREDGVDATWRLLTPLIEKLESEAGRLRFPNYASGSEGPAEALKLIEADGRKWWPI
jgi:glucose-6-phosphate 1-dehydrogenase